MAVGRTDEAVDLATARAGRNPDDLGSRLGLALFLYVKRDFEGAIDLLAESITPSSPESVLQHRIDERRIFAPTDWLGDALITCLCHAVGRMDLAAHHAALVRFHSKVSAFAGLGSLIDGVLFSDAARQSYSSDMQSNPPGEDENRRYAVTLALAYLAFERHADAIAMLQGMSDAGHPLAVWLHLWPVLSPLREQASFKELVRRMHLPD